MKKVQYESNICRIVVTQYAVSLLEPIQKGPWAMLGELHRFQGDSNSVIGCDRDDRIQSRFEQTVRMTMSVPISSTRMDDQRFRANDSSELDRFNRIVERIDLGDTGRTCESATPMDARNSHPHFE